MNSNWNVYKVFKNGKRAKAPLYEFSFSGDADGALRHFEDTEIKNLVEKFGKKFNNLSYQILNSNDSQERVTEDSIEENFSKEKNRVLGMLMRQMNFESEKKYGTGLILSADTDWKWQWCALEVATNRYIKGLSEHFNSYEEAYSWMTNLIDMSSTKE